MVRFSKIASMFLCLGLCYGLNAKTIVTVDGVAVSDSVFNGLKRQNPEFDYNKLPEAQKNQMLDEIVNSIVVANAAKKEGLDKSDEFKFASLQLLSQAWVGKQLESLSKTVSVSLQEAQKYYDDNKRLFEVQDADLRHILVAKEDQAKNIIAEIGKVPKTKTEEKFAELAKKYSIDEASKQSGGLMENFPIKGNPQVDATFAQEVSKMSNGSYNITPIRTRFGYHIVYVKRMGKPSVQAFDKIKDQLLELLKQQKMQAIITEKIKKLRDTSKITYGGK